MSERKLTNILLLIIALPIIFYILKILSFIFIPLLFSMFFALAFLPLMRKLSKKKVPRVINIIIVALIIALFFKVTGELIKLSSKEIINYDSSVFEKAEHKIDNIISPIESFLGIERVNDKSLLGYYIQKININKTFGSTIDFIGSTISKILMTAFFAILLLAESLNFQKILNTTIIKRKFSSIRVFMRIEKDILTFLKVKFLISLFTGIGFTIACYLFGISFPIFWGLIAFTVNFIQMIGSIVSTAILSLFAIVEMEPTGMLLFFILTITAIQVIMGSILEPIFMGKSFSINIITILIMLMFWSFLWGIPGTILAIPITVFLKIILDQFPKTKAISILMSTN